MEKIRSAKFESGLARRKRRVFVAWVTTAVVALVAVVGGTAYWLLWSGSFAITSPTVDGVDGATYDRVVQMLDRMMDSRLLGVVPSGRNELLFPDDALVAQVLAELKDVRSVAVEKDYPHGLVVHVQPRVSLGVWCRLDRCAHFDETGATFGAALPSTGSLLLAVHDQRPGDGDLLDRSFLEPVLTLAQLLREAGVSIREFSIPADSVLELQVRTMDGYDIRFATDAALDDQVRALTAFMTQKRQEDPTFSPAYVDVRIPGRLYYK